MVKGILSVIFIIALLVGGYFADKANKAPDVVAQPQQVQQEVKSASVLDTFTKITTADNSLSRVLEKGVITVGVQNPSKPFFYTSGGQAKGFNVDFLNLLLSQSEFGGKVKINTDNQVGSYEDIPGQILNGKGVDIVIDGLTFNNDDLDGVVYSIPYVKDFGYSLIASKDGSIKSVSDTAGATIGILQGDPDAKAFASDAFPNAKIVELSDRADSNGKWIVGHIQSGKVDAVMYDYPFAVAEVDGTDLQFAITKIEGSDIQYKIGVAKKDKELLVALNSAIRKAVNDEAYPEMVKEYFMSKNVATVKRAAASENIYVVVRGDTLSTIAEKELGDKMKYVDIQYRNNLANPNFISVGQKLVIPSK